MNLLLLFPPVDCSPSLSPSGRSCKDTLRVLLLWILSSILLSSQDRVFLFGKERQNQKTYGIGYQGLKNIPINNKFHLPLIFSSFEPLQGIKIVSKFNLAILEMHLVRGHETNGKHTSTPLGHFEYLVTMFGLSIFQALFNDVLGDFLHHFAFLGP